MIPLDLVLLLPGFFGFNRLSGFYYFAERVAAALRGGLDAREGRPIPVVSLSTLPASSLCDRQDALVSQIRALGKRLGVVPRLHLVGHSTGGVDGYLLTCERRIAGGEWTHEQTALRRRIASVTTVASPFHGTQLSVAAAAKFVLDPRHSCAGLVPALKLGYELVAQHAGNALFLDAAANALSALPDATRFCWNLVCHRKLIADLAPESMAGLLARSRRDVDAQITHFVTVVPEDRLHYSARFFADLYALTAANDRGDPTTPAITAAIELLNTCSSQAIRPPGSTPPIFSHRINDGVVNSCRQIADPSDRSTLGGIVVADHVDVIGHYDDMDALVTGPPLNESIFRSGAGFCDDQFYELHRQIAERIVAAMRVTRSVALRGVS